MNPAAPQNPRPRPWVFLNAALTADGKIATAGHAVHSFGSARDREHLYELRATADAILCGARTVEISGATLGNGGEKFRRRRLKNGRAEFPLRIIVSGGGTMDPAAKIFQTHWAPLLLLATRRAPEKNLKRLRPLVNEIKIFGGTELDFPAILRWLREKWNVRRLLCEGGGQLNEALIRAGLVDEIHATFCPLIFGGRTAPTLAEGRGRLRLAGAARFELTSLSRKNGELFTVFARAKPDR